MEKVFLASTNHFLYIFSRLLSLKAFFGLVETYFWGNPSFRLLEKDFTSNENRPLFENFFLLAKTVTDMSGNQFFNDRTYSCWWKTIFWKLETIYFHCLRFLKESLIPVSGNAFFSPKEKVFYSEFSFLLVETII